MSQGWKQGDQGDQVGDHCNDTKESTWCYIWPKVVGNWEEWIDLNMFRRNRYNLINWMRDTRKLRNKEWPLLFWPELPGEWWCHYDKGTVRKGLLCQRLWSCFVGPVYYITNRVVWWVVWYISLKLRGKIHVVDINLGFPSNLLLLCYIKKTTTTKPPLLMYLEWLARWFCWSWLSSLLCLRISWLSVYPAQPSALCFT